MSKRPDCTCRHVVTKTTVHTYLDPKCPLHTTESITMRVNVRDLTEPSRPFKHNPFREKMNQ